MKRYAERSRISLPLGALLAFSTLFVPSRSQPRIWTGKYWGLTIPGVNPCGSSPCLNSGTCSVVTPFYTASFLCHCGKEFTGDRCQTPVHECAQPECRHGTCVKNSTEGIRCECHPGYEGKRCETKITNPCANSPCLNGGKCFRHTNSLGFQCQCEVGYRGVTCQDRLANCKNCGQNLVDVARTTAACVSRPCYNGGRCQGSSSRTGYRCFCARGFTGERCQTSVEDRCDGQPCVSHTPCGDDDASCECLDGQSTTNCTSSNATTIPTTSLYPVQYEGRVGSLSPLIIIVVILAITILLCGCLAFTCRLLCHRKQPDDFCMHIPRGYIYHLRKGPSTSSSRERLSSSSPVRFYLTNGSDSADDIARTSEIFATLESNFCNRNVSNYR